MGIAFSIVAISLLAGTPIEGVLLQSQDRNFQWSRSIVFCGVRTYYFPHIVCPCLTNIHKLGYDFVWFSWNDRLAISVH